MSMEIEIDRQHPGFGQTYLGMAATHLSMEYTSESLVLDFLRDHGLETLAKCPGCLASNFSHLPLCPIEHSLSLMLGHAARNMKPEEVAGQMSESELEFTRERLGT
jgi:hypothetical protein